VTLIKTDVNGNKLWEKTFGGKYYDRGFSVQQTSDGGYVVGGQKSSGAGGIAIWLIKTDANGNESWDKTFGGESAKNIDVGLSFQQTRDGGYIIAGYTSNNVTTGPHGWWNCEGWLIKTDANGNERWNGTFGRSGDDELESVQQTSDGGFIVAGVQNEDFCLIKTDANGTFSTNLNGSNLPESPQQSSKSELQPAAGQPNYITNCIPNDKDRNDMYNRNIQNLYSANFDTVREGILNLDNFACSDQEPYCQFKDTRAVDPLIQLLNKTVYDRHSIIEILGCIGDNRAVEPLIQILNNESEEDYMRRDAAKSLGLLKDARAVDPLIQVLNDASVDRPTVIEALGAIKDNRAVDSLIQILEKDKNDIDRGTAAFALGNINDSRAVEPLIQALNEEGNPARRAAAEALGKIKDTRAVDPLIKALNDEDYLIRIEAAIALGNLGDAKAINPLKEALNDKMDDVKLSASKAIKELVGGR
jgi:HEAT repeat protein